MAIAHPPKQPSLLSNGIGGLGQRLLQRARASPWASAIMDGLHAWWQKNPARKVIGLAVPSAAPLVSSIGRKKPRAMLLGSASVGALLSVAPWRRLMFRLFRPTLMFGLLFEVVKASMRRHNLPETSNLSVEKTPLGRSPNA